MIRTGDDGRQLESGNLDRKIGILGGNSLRNRGQVENPVPFRIGQLGLEASYGAVKRVRRPDDWPTTGGLVDASSRPTSNQLWVADLTYVTWAGFVYVVS